MGRSAQNGTYLRLCSLQQTGAHCSKEPGLNTVDSAAPSFLMQICHQFQEPWIWEVVVGPT